MLLIVTTKYNTEKEPYTRNFLHTRVKKYLENNIETCVFVLSNKQAIHEYQYDGVRVVVGREREFVEFIRNNTVETICIHFITVPMMKALNKIDECKRIIVFVHGNEALHWYQRIFRGVLNSPRLALAFCKYAFFNIAQIHCARQFFKSSKHDISFVAVSNWMKEMAVHNWKCDARYPWHIIPNIIDNKLFCYQEKQGKDAFKLLSLRSFSSGKYANDLTVRLIGQLEKEAGFEELAITVIGKGALYKNTVKPLVGLKQVTLVNDLLAQNEVKKYHDQNGIFICPTRQDAQGVSMCEAMSSGLVPITLYNTAIPEYLPPDDRLRCYNVEDMRKLVLYLLSNPVEYTKLSKLCSDFVAEKCCESNTILRELDLFEKRL